MGALSGLRRSAAAAHRAKPFITDLGNGGRTEFTGAVFEQWVAKTANYLESEFDSGLHMHVRLRAHWLWPVLVGALDEIEGTLVPLERADLLLQIGMDPTSTVPVLAVNDHPMAMPFGSALPAQHHDFFLEVRGGGDLRTPGPAHAHPLIDDGRRRWPAAELVAATEPLAQNQRIGAFASMSPLLTPAAVAALSVLPWMSGSSLVIANDRYSARGEGITFELVID